MLPTGGGVPFLCGQDIVNVSLVRENGLTPVTGSSLIVTIWLVARP